MKVGLLLRGCCCGIGRTVNTSVIVVVLGARIYSCSNSSSFSSSGCW